MTASAESETEPLVESPLLAEVDVASRKAIVGRLKRARVAAGTPLLSQGQANTRLWFAVDGSIAVERRYPDGRVETLATFNGPGMFGTTTFFRSTAPTSTIRTTAEMTLWWLDRAGYESLRRDDPKAAEALALTVVRVLSIRFDLLDERISALMAEQGDGPSRKSELASFRSRLFEEPGS